MRAAGYDIGNIDSTVVVQAPRLAAHIRHARLHCGRRGCGQAQVNVKAKTAERLGPVGQGLAMEARCGAVQGLTRRHGLRVARPLHCPVLATWLVGTGDEGPVPLAGAAEQSSAGLQPGGAELPLDGQGAAGVALGVFLG